MYLSRIALDLNRRETMKALAQPSMLHGAVENCFNGERERKLWRLDNLNGEQYILILSGNIPDLNTIQNQFGYKSEKDGWEIKNYLNLLNRLETGQNWRFRLCANPVRSMMEGDSKRGKIYPHITMKHQKNWLFDRADKHGFHLEYEKFTVTRSERLQFRKNNNNIKKISLSVVDFEGVLTITDVACFKQTLINGVGRAKAYGCGLLTVMRI